MRASDVSTAASFGLRNGGLRPPGRRMIMASLPIPVWSEDLIGAPAPLPRQVRSTAPATAHFSDLEWSIVAMAERDGLTSLRKPNAYWSLIGALFGIKPANRLAGDRLEALRRVAVLAWRYRWNVPEAELKAFIAAGYSPDQFETMLGRISAIRAAQRGGHAR
jgi:hypothetical protein